MKTQIRLVKGSKFMFGLFNYNKINKGDIIDYGMCLELSDLEIGDDTTLSTYTFCHPCIEGKQLLLMGNSSYLNWSNEKANTSIEVSPIEGGRIAYKLVANTDIKENTELTLDYEKDI